MAKYSKAEIEEARAWFLKHLRPGDTLHTICDHVSRSGMSRNIRFVIVAKDGSLLHPNHSAAVLLGYSRAKRGDGVVVGGCGMDMGFACVYSISAVLFPHGFGVEGISLKGRKVRPVTKDQAAMWVAHGTKFCGRNGDKSGWDNYGGYAIKHRWL